MNIFKYKIAASHSFTLMMPRDARILSIQLQNDAAVLWASFEEKAFKVVREFRIYMTGEEFNADNHSYIATIQWPGGTVGHLYELEGKK